MDIPYQQLSEQALKGLLEEFVLREGTEYGAREFSLEEKTAKVKLQLERGEAKIVYDQELDTCDIVRVKR